MAKDSDSSIFLRDGTQVFIGKNAGDLPIIEEDGKISVDVLPAAVLGDITSVVAGTGMTGGGTSGAVTVNVDVGTTGSKIPQLTSGALPAVSGVNLTALNATELTSGTVPDARFPATLPAASGVNLTALNATELGSGTIPDDRFPAALPAISGAALTNLPAGAVTAKAKVKTANQDVVSSETLTADTDLTFTVEASETWAFEFVVVIATPNAVSLNYKFAVVAPSATSLLTQYSFIPEGTDAAGVIVATGATAGSIDTALIASGILRVSGLVVAGAAQRTVTIQFAQVASSGDEVQHQQGSYVTATKV